MVVFDGFYTYIAGDPRFDLNVTASPYIWGNVDKVSAVVLAK